MMFRRAATLTLAALILCCAAAAHAHACAHSAARAASREARSAPSNTTTVKRDEARFTLAVPQRPEWRWRMKETRVNAREYMMAVRVSNEGKEYSFGFYLWKSPRSSSGSGDLSSLIAAGQKSLFEHASAGHNVIVRDAGVNVRRDGDRIVITVKGKKNVARLFSGRPAEVRFETQLPGEPPTTQSVPVTYEN